MRNNDPTSHDDGYVMIPPEGEINNMCQTYHAIRRNGTMRHAAMGANMGVELKTPWVVLPTPWSQGSPDNLEVSGYDRFYMHRAQLRHAHH